MRGASRKLFILAVLSVLLGVLPLGISCGSNVDTSNSDTPLVFETSKFIGEWEWVKSGGGITGNQTSTPDSIGHSRSIVFDEYGKFVEYQDGVASDPGSYQFKIAYTIYSADPKLVIQMYHYSENNVYPVTWVYSFEGNNTLHLSDNAYDGFGHEYRRVSSGSTIMPIAILSGQPVGNVKYWTADIRVAGNDVVSYQYKLDSGDWSIETPIKIHINLSNLADGEHTVYVRGKDAAGNWQTEFFSTTATWTVNIQAVIFPDSGLESAIRKTLNMPQGNILKSDLERLTELRAVGYNISDLTGLEYCTNLTKLNINNNQISDITALSSLTGLTSLNLAKNPISDLSPLSSLTRLTSLDLWMNEISDISALSPLTGLTELRLWDNKISDISALSTLTGLTSLNLAINQISDLSPLSSLTRLTVISLFENQISNISPISSLTSLTRILIDHNQISDISPVSLLSNLDTLDIGNNLIEDISPLSSMTSLTYIGLSDNRVSNIEPLMSNTGLGHGTEVYLQNNPLNDNSINTSIPALQARGVKVHYEVRG